ncbi:MAG: hypothetical protein H6954_01665 [Chromatiaceae bacterium]|nr:hypothetical protein [Chromatiaceae bacterium]
MTPTAPRSAPVTPHCYHFCMVRKRDRTNVYILLLAILVAAIAGYYLPTKRPETGASMTPKEYIELVEKKKAQRLRYGEATAPADPGRAADRAAPASR